MTRPDDVDTVEADGVAAMRKDAPRRKRHLNPRRLRRHDDERDR